MNGPVKMPPAEPGLPSQGPQRPWREIADLLAGELAQYATCTAHPPAAAQEDCRACAARAAMSIYKIARGQPRLGD